MLTVSTVIADDAVSTTPEMCSNGTGTIVIGAVTGHKYCKSNQRMNWWNAYAWCDAQGRQLFNMDSCMCSGITNCQGVCLELMAVGSGWIWSSTPRPAPLAYGVLLSSGKVNILSNYYCKETYDALCF